jgi:aldose 1-epimerase
MLGAAPSGQQWHIRHGDQHATVAEVGAAVVEYRVGGRDVFQPPADSFAPTFHGAVLLPWPNRLRDGRYRFDGVDYQVAISEPERMTALHGLSPWAPWSLLTRQDDRIVLSMRLLPSPGYPFHLDSEVEYVLVADGLRVTATSTNVGDEPLPYAVGFHPYLSGGGARLDDCVLRIDASRRFLTDERLLPTGLADVASTPFDFRVPRPLGSLQMDTAFTDVPRDADGRAWLALAAPDGHTAAIWSDSTCSFWQIYTGDTLPGHLFRRGMAAEPMTAAPDAFNNGLGLRTLAPGESAVTSWGAQLRQTLHHEP